MSTEPIVPPGGNFPTPATSTVPLLALRCVPALRPYLAEDAASANTILIDAPVTYTSIAGAEPIIISTGSLAVTVNVNGKALATGVVPLNATKFELPFSLAGLTPQMSAYNVSCTATYNSQTFSASASLSYLPNPKNSSVTKIDMRTGALLAKPANGKGGAYQPIFPMGNSLLLSSSAAINHITRSQAFTPVSMDTWHTTCQS